VEEDPGAAMEADIRRRRRRLVLIVVGLFVVAGLAGVAALTFRDRTVYLIGAEETVTASVEGGPRFRLQAPYSLAIQARPGRHAVTALRGPAVGTLDVPWAPWTNQVVAPTGASQCLIVASANGMYGEGGAPDTVYVHDFTREPRSVALPPMFSDVVATHPCHLPPAIQLLDTIVMVATVPCAEAPSSEAEARAIVLAQISGCGYSSSSLAGASLSSSSATCSE